MYDKNNWHPDNEIGVAGKIALVGGSLIGITLVVAAVIGPLVLLGWLVFRHLNPAH